MTLRSALMPMLCAVLFCPSEAVQEAQPKVIQERSFYVAGYSVRTNNADEAAGRGRIGDLWQRFRQRNLGAAISNRVDDDLVVVYSNYASDEHGDYTYLLGARVSSPRGLPPAITCQKIAAGPYAVFATKQGPVPEVVPAEWKRIWKTSPEEMGGQRAFTSDYEVYGNGSANPQWAQVEIHIGLKSGQ